MKFYTFSPKHFAMLVETIDDSGTFMEFWRKKKAIAYAFGDEKKEIRKIHKDVHSLVWSRCAVLVATLATMGNISVRVKVMKGQRVPFIKFWPAPKHVEYWSGIDKKKLVEK